MVAGKEWKGGSEKGALSSRGLSRSSTYGTATAGEGSSQLGGDKDDSLGPEFHGGKIYQHSKGLVHWSPDGQWLAIAVGTRVFIRDRETMEIQRILHCVDAVEAVEWAKDSDLILCAMYKRATVMVYKLSDETWNCRITEGVAGISSAMWAPDSRHLLTFTDFHLCLAIWPLRSPTQPVHVQKPKVAAFSADGTMMAVACRVNCRDKLLIYATKGWQALRGFQMDTVDLTAIRWSPDGTCIAVQDTSLSYGLHVYSPDGRKRYELKAYEDALGVKTMAWSPCGRFLAVGSYDQCVRIISSIAWTVVAEFKHTHPRSLPPGNKSSNLTCYVEEEGEYVQRPVSKLPPQLPSTKPDPNLPNPKLGVGQLSWSPDGRYLLSRNENMASILWIWDVTDALGLCSILLHSTAVKSAQWSSSSSPSSGAQQEEEGGGGAAQGLTASSSSPSPQLAIVKGGKRFFVWSPDSEPCWYDVPVNGDGFEASRVRWATGPRGGGALAIMTVDQLCVCTLQQ